MTVNQKLRHLFIVADWYRIQLPDRLLDSKPVDWYEACGMRLLCRLTGHVHDTECGVTYCVYCRKIEETHEH